MKLELVEHRAKINEEGNWMTNDVFKIGDYRVERFREAKPTYTYEGISVVADYDAKREKYLPEIYYNNGRFDDRGCRFEIQTTAYGSMDAEGIQKVIAGYQTAVAVAEALTVEFIKEG